MKRYGMKLLMSTDKHNRQTYLLSSQYKNADNLKARIALHENFGNEKVDFHHWLFEKIDIPGNARILEIGSGSARIWLKNKRNIPKNWQIILSDFSSGMLAEAQRNVAEIKHKFSFRKIDIQYIPFENSSFDMLMANHMLYHVPDIDKALAEVKRVLKDEGKFYAATNGNGHMLELNQFLLYAAKLLPNDTVYKINRKKFSLESGKAAIKKHFDNVEIFPFNNYLIIDKAEPLFAYIMSLVDLKRIEQDFSLTQQEQALKQIIKFIEVKLKKGPIKISTRTGLFVAS